MKLAIGCDPNAMDVKNKLIEHLDSCGHEIIDMGSEDVIYANTAFAVASMVVSGKCERGILICGTGIGMSIAANKVDGVNAALLTDVYSATRATKSNNSNIACFGAFTLGYRLIECLCDVYLSNEYVDGTGSAPKVARIADYEKCRKPLS